MYARLRTRAHKSTAKLQKKIDIHNSVCHFSAFFLLFALFLLLFAEEAEEFKQQIDEVEIQAECTKKS